MRFFSYSAFIIGLISTAANCQTDSFPQILICIDSSGKAQTKPLVYAYIGGTKTSCMPRKDLLSLIAASKAAQDSAALEPRNREARIRKAASNDLVDQIIAGKKDLAGVDLRGRDLMGLDFNNADLTGANLSSADLRNTRFTNAILKNADLSAAFFRSANCNGADLTGAKLENTIFTRADLRKVRGLTILKLDRVKNLNAAKLDSAFAVEALEEYPEKFEPPKKCWDNSWAKNFDCTDDDVDVGEVE